MKKCIFSFFGSLLCLFGSAQSKVFKEVGEGMSSQINVIKQDNALVGYLVFTRLEKANADSFNYRISIMDENLNDIGTVNFKEGSLQLNAVSFDQDVLCLAYLKSNVIGNDFKSRSEFKGAMNNEKSYVLTQFLGLDGKIIKTNTSKVDIDIDRSSYGGWGQKYVGTGNLKHHIQLRNISGKGFASFYGDEQSNFLTVYDAKGNELWRKKVGRTTNNNGYYLHTANDNIYLLAQNKGEKIEGGYELMGYTFADTAGHEKYSFKDKKGNQLKVLAFDNDPVTGKAYVSGMIINDQMNGLYTMKDVSKGPYSGVFTINLNGIKKTDYKESFSYWNNGSSSGFTETGKVVDEDAYPLLTNSFKDYQGNTYFMGSGMIRKTRWGSIISSVILSPLIVVSPMILMAGGTTKCKFTDAMLLKQNEKGALVYERSVPSDNGIFHPGHSLLAMEPLKDFYHVSNSDTKSDYVIIDGLSSIVVYNVTAKKTVRTIPHKDGGIRTYVFPAKEGHIMVSEYNKKEKTTRVSIESI